MSKQQWGHGYHTGYETAARELLLDDFVVGHCDVCLFDEGNRVLNRY